MPEPTPLAALAAAHGLGVSGARPPLAEYTRQLWSRRHFIRAFATARASTPYTQARLGQLWQVGTPLLNAAVYFLVFGSLLGSGRGVPDYIPFLCTGIFDFTFTQSAVLAGARSLTDNMGLVRALHFPRAGLPLAVTLAQLQQLLLSLGVLAVIVVASGVPVTARWLLAVPALGAADRLHRGTGPGRGPDRRPHHRLRPAAALRGPQLDVRVRDLLRPLPDHRARPPRRGAGAGRQPGAGLRRADALRPDRQRHRRPAAAPRVAARADLGECGGVRGIRLLLVVRGGVRTWLNRPQARPQSSRSPSGRPTRQGRHDGQGRRVGPGPRRDPPPRRNRGPRGRRECRPSWSTACTSSTGSTGPARARAAPPPPCAACCCARARPA
ncbi:hypothetical protein SBRY_80037 [Actinacidiphila bryophytorum]|uniref:ABC-2 type transporter domain-containing protein n=1 Tax=Actinacidiphila bryophytorum TaxID=1436133 RepID=A0A9W4MHK2_9ACTN|nr:hypothetical protein SBRY_80037 [Actinacidiphila bryophytorum]